MASFRVLYCKGFRCKGNGGEMNIVTWIVFVVGVGILCLLDYFISKDKLGKIQRDQKEMICRKRDKWEAFFNVMSMVYLSVIFYLLDIESIKLDTVIGVAVSVFFVFIELNVRIYMYKTKIRELEMD